jgi:2-C-methyl-D-erythritol 4-phosphate cytidylyltransferase
MIRAGRKVQLVENPDWNFKVTLPKDVGIADFLLRARAAESMS